MYPKPTVGVQHPERSASGLLQAAGQELLEAFGLWVDQHFTRVATFFDLAFVPPRGRLAVSDTQYLITFAVMTAVSLLIGRLAAELREQARTAEERERRTAELYAQSQELARERAALARSETS